MSERSSGRKEWRSEKKEKEEGRGAEMFSGSVAPLPNWLPRQRKKRCRKEKGGLEVSPTLGHPEVYGVFITPLSHKHWPYFRTLSASSPQKGKKRKHISTGGRGAKRGREFERALHFVLLSEFAGLLSF